MLTILWVLLAALIISVSLIIFISVVVFCMRFYFAKKVEEILELDPDTEEVFFSKN